jgi:hypothetical protein
LRGGRERASNAGQSDGTRTRFDFDISVTGQRGIDGTTARVDAEAACETAPSKGAAARRDGQRAGDAVHGYRARSGGYRRGGFKPAKIDRSRLGANVDRAFDAAHRRRTRIALRDHLSVWRHPHQIVHGHGATVGRVGGRAQTDRVSFAFDRRMVGDPVGDLHGICGDVEPYPNRHGAGNGYAARVAGSHLDLAPNRRDIELCYAGHIHRSLEWQALRRGRSGGTDADCDRERDSRSDVHIKV